MRTDILHRRIMRDIEVMFDAIDEVFPVKMPVQYDSHQMYLGAFIKRLNCITTQYNILNIISDDATLAQTAMVVSGVWVPEDELPEYDSMSDIQLHWHTHPGERCFQMTPMRWAKRRFYFWERVGHELVHRHQFVYRTNDSCAKTFRVTIEGKDQDYYGNYDELEAYAHDAALELVAWWPMLTFREAVREAAQLTNCGGLWSTYSQYISAFEPGHPARQHFLRKMKSWHGTMQTKLDFYAQLALPKLLP